MLLVLLGLVSYAANNRSAKNDAVQTQGEAVSDLPVPPPPPTTATMQAVLDKSVGFSMLVSYTENGFEPSDTTIRRGESVRFTNNSQHPVWISAVAKNGVIYPATAESCGQSAFDTCAALPPYEIWEFTFNEPGTWGYRNNAEQTHVGVIHVQ